MNKNVFRVCSHLSLSTTGSPQYIPNWRASHREACQPYVLSWCGMIRNCPLAYQRCCSDGSSEVNQLLMNLTMQAEEHCGVGLVCDLHMVCSRCRMANCIKFTYCFLLPWVEQMLACVDTDGQRWWDVLSVGRREFWDDAVFQWSHRWCYESRPLTIRVRKYLCFWGNLCVCLEFVSSWH